MSSFFSDLDSDQEPKKQKTSSFFSDLPEKQSKLRSKISAPTKGILKGLQDLASLAQPYLAPGPINKKLGERLIEQALPSNEEDAVLERAGKLLPLVAAGEETIPLKLAQLAASTLGGELAQSAGLGETGQSLAEAASMGLPGLAKGLGQQASKLIKGVKNKLPSGLTQIKATEAKFPKLGTLSKEREAKVIDTLNQEAKEISEKIIKKRIPLSQKLEREPQFKQEYAKRFGEIERLAKEQNSILDTHPVKNFLSQTEKKYSGISNLHPDAKKIVNEIKSFSKKPFDNLYDGIKNFRSINRKLDSIYEKRALFGKQKEYVDFLNDYKRSITESIEKTFPEDSEFVRLFKETNRGWSNIENAEQGTKLIKEAFGEEINPSKITRLISDPRIQNKLKLKIGKEGSDEVIQLAQDLKQSIEALKKIPKSQWTKFDSIFPLYYFIPWVGKYFGAKKTYDAAKYFYGWSLSTPSRMRLVKQALDSIIKNDLKGYEKAAYLIKRDFDETDE